ncbi:Uncharacterised protein [Klebsiella pneumoniae]|nr:Uncharacterised protein [Klebsiella pneumoniae]
MLTYSIIIITKRISSYCPLFSETRKMRITTTQKCYLSHHQKLVLFFSLKSNECIKNQANLFLFYMRCNICIFPVFNFTFYSFVHFYCGFYLLTTIIRLAYYAQYTVFALQIFPIIVFKIYIKFNDVLMVSLCSPIIATHLVVNTRSLKRSFMQL